MPAATYLGNRIETLSGDITRLPMDAIVNAANAALCGGGGGAIQRACGDRTAGGLHPRRRSPEPG